MMTEEEWRWRRCMTVLWLECQFQCFFQVIYQIYNLNEFFGTLSLATWISSLNGSAITLDCSLDQTTELFYLRWLKLSLHEISVYIKKRLFQDCGDDYGYHVDEDND